MECVNTQHISNDLDDIVSKSFQGVSFVKERSDADFDANQSKSTNTVAETEEEDTTHNSKDYDPIDIKICSKHQPQWKGSDSVEVIETSRESHIESGSSFFSEGSFKNYTSASNITQWRNMKSMKSLREILNTVETSEGTFIFDFYGLILTCCSFEDGNHS